MGENSYKNCRFSSMKRDWVATTVHIWFTCCRW